MGACFAKHKDDAGSKPATTRPQKGRVERANRDKKIKAAKKKPMKQDSTVSDDLSAPGVSSHKGKNNKETVSGFSRKKLEKLFDKYKEAGESEDSQIIGPDGIEKMCNDLEIVPEDVTTLLLAYHLNAQEMGYFSRKEFLEGLEKMGIDSIERLKEQLGKMKTELNDTVHFKNVYRFAFMFSKEDPEQKVLEMEMASGMLSLLLAERYPVINSFLEYLKVQTTYKGLNIDQWMNLLEFCKVVGSDFSKYDENGAWPCLIDDYICYMQSKDAENVS